MSDQPLELGAGAGDILAHISVGCFALDNDWRFTYANTAAARTFGSEIAELVGQSVFDRLRIAPDNPFQARYLASKQSGEPAIFTAYSENLGGWFEIRGYPHPTGYTVFFRDVTDERSAHLAALERERAIAAAGAINQRIFETSVDLILVVDRKGTFIRVSPSSLAILGYRPDELIGHSAAETLYPEDLESTRQELRLARRGKAMRNFECRYIHKDGRIVTLAWTGVWSEPEQQHFFIGRDMTERIAAEERLRHAQRLEAVGQLTGGIAHDFNNLLGIIIGNLDLMRDAIAPDSAAGQFLKEVLEAALRGAELTSRLLAFARRQQLRPGRADVNALVGGTAKLLGRVLGENVGFDLHLKEDLWPARVDSAQLEAAITNLATNARDAMSKGGMLIVRTTNSHLDEAFAAEHADVAAGDYVLIEVCDTGAGMSEEIQAHIFEPFFSTKHAGKGSGLGLSMVYGFVKQSGGHIGVYSEPGKGTCIRLYLPRDTSAAAPAAIAEAAEARGGHETILVVEDNARLRRVVVRQLADLGYTIIEAEDAASALAAIPGAKIDLLLTDIVMPGALMVPDLAREALALAPGLKVLFTSGYPQTRLTEGQGPEDIKLLSKPYRKQDLARALREALDGGQDAGRGAAG